MRTTALKITLSFLFILLLGACRPAAQPGAFAANSWILTTLGGEPIQEGVITAEVAEGNQVSGSAGCNQYSTTYTSDGENLEFSDEIVLTRMMCTEPLMDLESAYLEVLANTARGNVDGNNLTLLDAQGNELATFTRLEPADLSGTNWQVTSFNNGQGAIVSTLPEAPVIASFRADNSLIGFSGCNAYSHQWNTDGFAISVTIGSQTRYACGDEIMLQEAAYQAAFGMAGVYKVLGDAMEFRNSAGDLIMTFVRLENLPLAGPNWIVQSINNLQDALMSPIRGTDLNLNLDEAGNASGSSGCNTFSGSYEATDTTLTFGPLASTMMACEDDIMNQEAAYLNALQSTALFEVQGNFLLLKDASERVLVVLRATIQQ
jgi:heat shock protein HslJ